LIQFFYKANDYLLGFFLLAKLLIKTIHNEIRFINIWVKKKAVAINGLHQI